MLLAFHVCVHARPDAAIAGPRRHVAGVELETLAVAPADLPPLGTSFEEAAAELAALPRMYCEPDGSFVWVSTAGETTWQVDGNLYDRAGRLLFVDLKGCCSAPEFDRLLRALGWPETPVIFQLVREAIYLDEGAFRRHAAAIAAQANAPRPAEPGA
ncbi:MAG: hypothetical protein JNG90_08275 [Planctomycetaceae bacterium]|nr:hypothetical protein [Planctomycetaceae bacterium]